MFSPQPDKGYELKHTMTFSNIVAKVVALVISPSALLLTQDSCGERQGRTCVILGLVMLIHCVLHCLPARLPARLTSLPPVAGP